jgi:predicted component of type VI protein secretion system
MAADKADKPLPRPAPAPVTSTAARTHLECIAGPEKGQTLRVAPNITVLGRDASCDVALLETSISRQHCRIERRGDQWFLKNLSANGTLLNKKRVDEASLANGDEIRLGAKTRLRFVVEAVALSATGRPQFRRRTGQAEDTAQTEAASPEAKPEAAPSLFRRGRKGTAIAILVTMPTLLFMGVIVYKALAPAAKVSVTEVPALAMEDRIVPSPGAEPLQVERDSPEGVWCKDLNGASLLVPRADLNSGQAVWVPGIEHSLDRKFKFDPNQDQAESNTKMGVEQYRISRTAGREDALFRAVRYFQRALGYADRSYFEDPTTDKMYQKALAELIEYVNKTYRQAVHRDEADDYREAWMLYRQILKAVDEKENPIYANVARRSTDLRNRHSELNKS